MYLASAVSCSHLKVPTQSLLSFWRSQHLEIHILLLLSENQGHILCPEDRVARASRYGKRAAYVTQECSKICMGD